ncbi:MAG: hypothetical protein Kow0042_29820 [Calditrichia bacterium]
MTSYTDEDVPHIGRIVTMFQDSRGWMWFGGELGILIYDGQDFLKYNRTDGLPGNYTFSFREAIDGKIWISTYNGLGVYNPEDAGVSTIPMMQNHTARDVLFKNNVIFLATDGDVSYLIDTTRYHINLPERENANFISTSVRMLLPDTNDSFIWAATERAGLLRMEWKPLLRQRLKKNIVPDIEKLNETYQYTRTHVKTYYHPQYPRSWDILSIARHPNGSLYAQTRGGIFKVEGNSFIPLPGLSRIYPNSSKLQIDANGRFYLSGPEGLAIVDGPTIQWFTRENGLASDNINAVYIDRQNNLWIASGNGRIQKVSNIRWHYWDEHSLPGLTDIIHMLALSSDSVLIACRNHLWLYYQNQIFPYPFKKKTDELIAAIGLDGEDKIVVVTTKHVYRMEGKETHIIKELENPGYTLGLTHLDQERRLWIILGYEVWIWDGRQMITSDFLREQLSFTIHISQTPDGKFFFGTWKGLYRYQPGWMDLFTRSYHQLFGQTADNRWELASHNEYDFPRFRSEVLIGSVVDFSGKQWFCSFKGDILQMTGDSLYSVNEQYRIAYTTWIAMKRMPNGTIYILGDRYFIKIDGTEVHVVENPVLPDIVYSDVIVDDAGTEYFATSVGLLIHKDGTWFHLSGKSGLPESSVDKLVLTADQHLLLQHNMGITSLPISSLLWTETTYTPPLIIGFKKGKRFVLPNGNKIVLDRGREIIFKASYGDLSDENLVRYSWQLKGFDPRFSDWSEKCQPRYTNLPPGTYRFEVRATSLQQANLISEKSIHVIIKPTFIESGYFKTIMFILVVVVAYSAHWFRTKTLRRRERHLNHLVKERTRDLQVFNMLAEASGLGLLIVTLDKKVVYANPAFYQMVGGSKNEEEPEWNFLNIFPPDTGRKVENEILNKVLNEGQWLGELHITPNDSIKQMTTIQNLFKIDGKDEMPTLFGVVITNITERKEMELELKRTTEELKEALENIKVLSGLVPICSSCKKIRNDKGFWQQVEDYISEHSEARFSHGICPDCFKRLYPEFIK